MSGARYVTKLDIHETYHRLRIASGYKWKTAFCTCYSHYEYNIVGFSLVDASVAFHGHINNVLRKHLNQFYIAYLDDIVVYSNLPEEHREHVQLVLM